MSLVKCGARQWVLVYGSCCVFLLGGCISLPQPAYRKVDVASPQFKSAVALETEKQLANGNSARAAEKISTARVVEQFAQAEKTRRLDSVAPLLRAMGSFERPRTGCWACVVTTTTRAEKGTTVKVERFDPFQPEERLWTLLSRDGVVPDEKAQAAYRSARLRPWRREQRKKLPDHPTPERVKFYATSGEIDITPASSNTPQTFSFLKEETKIPFVADIPKAHITYQIDASGENVLRRTQTNLGPVSLMGGSLKLPVWEISTDYLVIDPSLPPFVEKSAVHLHAIYLGKDSGDVWVERIYSDYRRVKCFEDRFGVSIGEPITSDFLPE